MLLLRRNTDAHHGTGIPEIFGDAAGGKAGICQRVDEKISGEEKNRRGEGRCR